MNDGLDSLRADILMIEASLEKTMDDFDRGLARIVWAQVHDLFGRAFAHQVRADEAFARKNWVEYHLSRGLATLTVEMARELAKIVETLPSIREAVRAA